LASISLGVRKMTTSSPSMGDAASGAGHTATRSRPASASSTLIRIIVMSSC
jgi:hypothetical protein